MSTLRFLSLEDVALDAEVIQVMLIDGGIDYELHRVETRADFVAALESQEFDLILADYALPAFDGLSALEIARNLCPDVPFIFVSASLGEELAIEALKRGATDYVLKQRLGRLVPCVQRALREAQERRERKQTEAALHQSEASFRAVAANLPNGAAFIVDQELRYRLAEGQAIKDASMTSESLVGKTLWEALEPALADYYEPYFRQALGGEPYSLEHHSHDRYYISHGTPLYNDQGEVDAVLAVSYDISNRKRSEAEREHLLAREQEHTAKLHKLNQAALALNTALSLKEVLHVVVDQAYQIIGTHQSVINLVFDGDWSQTETIAHLSDKYAQWREYDAQPDGSGIYSIICEINQSIRMTQAELEAHPRWRGFGAEVGKHPPLRGLLSAPLSGRNGQILGLLQLSDKYEGDFTEEDEALLVQLAQMASIAVENARLYEAEQQARALAEAAREEAVSANRIKDEFLAVLSHELRSPLNPILGWANLLRNGRLDAARAAFALETIERNAKLQVQLIEDLLDVSRILRGKLSLNAMPLDLKIVIAAALETVRLAAEAKSLDLIFETLDPELEDSFGSFQVTQFNQSNLNLRSSVNAQFQVLGDPGRLQQVVWNLLSNAVKFTPFGGRIEVRLEHVEASRVNAPPSSFPSYAQITVSDTGKGIQPDFLPHVFEYFHQEDATTTRRFGGLGLGLAIARQIVELHGGTIAVDSLGEGQGATVTVQLPLAPPLNPVPSPEPLLAPMGDLGGIHILVVDDEPDLREFVAFVLEQAGAIVTSVSCGVDALRAIEQSFPTLLISDIGMPEMDGYMLLQQVRALNPTKQILAIALTAYAGELDRQQALQVGFQQHLSKPIEPDELIKAISQLIDRGSYG